MRTVRLIRAPWREPLEALSACAAEPFALALLSDGAGERGRWSYLARAPDRVLVRRPEAGRDPFAALEALLGEAGETDPDGPPFQGGVAGLAAYELGERIETLGRGRAAPWPDLACARYPALLAFDHAAREVVAVGRGGDASAAVARARGALSWLDRPGVAGRKGRLAAGPMMASDGGAYEAAVARVVEKIAAGEIFQANVARAWTGRLAAGAEPFDLAARLAGQSGAPFAAYLRLPGLAVVSNSPERFVSVRREADGLVAETRPIKGTRPRGATPAEDARLAAELLASAKDRAENLMIVDLMRNDLARTCAPGTVRTPELFAVESFANVHHLVSTVRGRIGQGRSALDLFRAAFPPGSVTGAPKVQAMRTIASLEPPRGPYCGSLFWAGFDGAFDSSVLIRSAACVADAAGWAVEARAGAGLVADSEPAAERAETEAKIAALLRALEAPAC